MAGETTAPRHRLLLLRHAKSAWDTSAPGDFERPLAPRGRRDAPRMARWLLERALVPDRVLCSSAVRTRQTVDLMRPVLGLEPDQVEFDDELYHAGLETLLATLRAIEEDCGMLLLVGHNPGLEDLLLRLAEDPLQRTPKGKLMTTAAVADIELRAPWVELDGEHCRVVQLVRPKELPEPRQAPAGR